MKMQNSVKRFARLTGLAAMAAMLTAAHPSAHGAEDVRAPAEDVQSADTSTAVGTVVAFHAALASGDMTAALGLLAEDVMIFESGGVESNRAEYASHHLQADAAFSAAVLRMLVSRTQGETADTAWVLSIETVTGTFRERAINSRSVETMLLRRVQGQWRIAHIHWSSTDLGPREP